MKASVARMVRSGCAVLLLTHGLVACDDSTAPTVEGVIYDAVSQQPLAGVYVLATYEIGEAVWFGHSGSVCNDARGMYTGPDGRYSFPIIKSVKPHVHAAAVDRVWSASGSVVKKGFFGNKTVPNNDIFLKHRSQSDRPHPTAVCEHAKWHEARAANIQYLEIVKASNLKYGQPVEALSNLIRVLQP